MNEWLDKWGLIKSRRNQDSTGNGMLYSVLFNVFLLPKIVQDRFLRLENSRFAGDYRYVYVDHLWNSFEGYLMRTPDNSFGQESVDNYLAYALHLLSCGNIEEAYARERARQILKSAVKKLFYMKNVPFHFDHEKTFFGKVKRVLAPAMIRFPIVWLIFTATAFPRVRRVCGFFINLLANKKPDKNNSDQLQLTICVLFSVAHLYKREPLEEFFKTYAVYDTLKNYYDEGHPLLGVYQLLQESDYKP